jgi:murein DD-endopeptidase MepM/ murein hydrolase activator NlpD
VETRYRREKRTETEILYDADGFPYGEQEIDVYEDIYYDFWILTVKLEPKNLSDVLRNRMTADEEMHFDILGLTGNGRQVVGNPFGINWLPYISNHYGYRVHPISNTKQLHMGIDIAAPTGTPIYATHTGTINDVQFSDTGYGNMIRLNGEGADGVIVETLFAHLHEIHVTNGQEVIQGELIATVGSSGDSTDPHLHLEVFRPSQQITENGTTTTLPAMHLNPIFAVITWTDEESNDVFRPLPGTGGIRNGRPLFIPEIPPEAMSDERFMAILTEASRHLGARYVWGSAGPITFDCSGFIHWVFSNAGIGWTHGRTTTQGYFNMTTPVTAENARPGDMVFFHSYA